MYFDKLTGKEVSEGNFEIGLAKHQENIRKLMLLPNKALWEIYKDKIKNNIKELNEDRLAQGL